MTLPNQWHNNKKYFHDSVLFLQKYKWLYSTPNTHILVEKLLKQIPHEWQSILNKLETDELNQLPFGYFQDNWPKSLIEFILKIESFKSKRTDVFPRLENNLPQQFFKGLNQKKIHEILILAPFIHENCKSYDTKTKVIIDIGAGLGYLPQLLHKIYGYKILAIEANQKYVDTAIRRQNEIYSSSLDDIKYIQHFVNENSAEFLQDQIHKHHKNISNICLIGLHACSDLSITLLKLFSKMSCVNQAIVMPCCYHRLEKVTDRSNLEDINTTERFVNFPVSCSLREVYENQNADQFLTGAFLRLACQSAASSWKSMSAEDHRIHAVGAMRRNVLQLVAQADGYHLSRLKRKTHAPEKDDFLSYLDGLKQTHTLVNPSNEAEEDLIISQRFRDKMAEVWSSYENDCSLMEAYTAFQTSLQSVCENIVLLDRVEMVREWGHFCTVQKVTDDSISPRCHALVARKH